MKRAKIKIHGIDHEPEPNKARLEVTRDWAILTETVRSTYAAIEQALKLLVPVHDEMKSINVNIYPIKVGTKIRWEQGVERVRTLLESLTAPRSPDGPAD